MIQAFIFDMDGVIINSEPMHKQAERQTMAAYGVELQDEDQKGSVGMTEQATFAKWIEKYRLPTTSEKLMAEKNAIYLPLLQNQVELMEGAKDLIEFLHAHEVPMAIATSSYRNKVDIVEDRFGLRSYFKVMVSASDIKNGKPDPEIYLKAAEKLGVAPQDCWVLEDAASGVAAGKAAGMTVIGFKSPYTVLQNLSQADHIVSRLSQVEELLKH